MVAVDQQKIRRARTGLIAHDPALAQPGYTLFAPMYGDGTVYLVDMAGKVTHTWQMPHRPGLYGYLLDDVVAVRAVQRGSSRALNAPCDADRASPRPSYGHVNVEGIDMKPHQLTSRGEAGPSSMRCTRSPPSAVHAPSAVIGENTVGNGAQQDGGGLGLGIRVGGTAATLYAPGWAHAYAADIATTARDRVISSLCSWFRPAAARQ
jgi:hypothetical protein